MVGVVGLFTSCGGQSTAPQPQVAAVTLNIVSAAVQVGETLQVTARANDASGGLVPGATMTWSSSNPSIATVTPNGLVTGAAPGSTTITASAGGKNAVTTITVTPPAASITISPATDTIVVRRVVRYTASVRDAAGAPLTGLRVRWRSSNPSAASADTDGLVTTLMADTATITATTWHRSTTALLTITPSSLPIRGLYVQFERRGWAAEYWSGQVIHQFDSVDAVVGTTVATEVGTQLDIIDGLGVNTIGFELRSTDSIWVNDGFTPPTCNIPPTLGVRWPNATTQELANLVAFFDLVQSKGMRVMLRLVNTHMEEQPPANSTAWLGAILGALKGHPALELVFFEGAPHVNGNGTCGIPAEPPLWEGPTSVAARYVTWAIGYGRSLGLPARQLSAEAIVGAYNVYYSQEVGGPNHQWDPVVVEQSIFDALQIPDSERTYGVSFYEHRKCVGLQIPCVDLDPDQWADSTLARVFAVIGPTSRARVIAGELGYLPPVDPSWSAVQALSSIITRMRRRGMDGGAFWRWVSFSNSEDADPTIPEPVKRRGVAYVYNPVKDVLVQLYHAP